MARGRITEGVDGRSGHAQLTVSRHPTRLLGSEPMTCYTLADRTGLPHVLALERWGIV
jgi:hypothetical protein